MQRDFSDSLQCNKVKTRNALLNSEYFLPEAILHLPEGQFLNTKSQFYQDGHFDALGVGWP